MSKETQFKHDDTFLLPFAHHEGIITNTSYIQILNILHTITCPEFNSSQPLSVNELLVSLQESMKKSPKTSIGTRNIKPVYAQLYKRDSNQIIITNSEKLMQLRDSLHLQIYHQLAQDYPDIDPRDLELDMTQADILYYENDGYFPAKRDYYDRYQQHYPPKYKEVRKVPGSWPDKYIHVGYNWKMFTLILNLDSSILQSPTTSITNGFTRLYLPTIECRRYYATQTTETPRQYPDIYHRQLIRHDFSSSMRPKHYLMYDSETLSQSLSVGDNGRKLTLQLKFWVHTTPSMITNTVPNTCYLSKLLPISIHAHQYFIALNKTTTILYQLIKLFTKYWLQSHCKDILEYVVQQYPLSAKNEMTRFCSCVRDKTYSYEYLSRKYCVCSCELCCHNNDCIADNKVGRDNEYFNSIHYYQDQEWSDQWIVDS